MHRINGNFIVDSFEVFLLKQVESAVSKSKSLKGCFMFFRLYDELHGKLQDNLTKEMVSYSILFSLFLLS